MKKFTIITLIILALFSACGKPGGELQEENKPVDPSDPDTITINIVMSGDETGDNVTASPAFGKAGIEITLNYTLANVKLHNRLVFSGTKTAIAQVDSAGNGSKKYTVNAEDAAEGVITINAVFTHSDKELDTIAFADTANVTKTLGDAPFTKAITNRGKGTGAISYASSDPSVAEVNSATGEVTIIYVGTAEITATKAADAVYEKAEARYTLTVVHKVIEVPRTALVDFEADAVGKTYESTKAGSAPTVKVAADPLNSGQKSLQITSTTYNQAAIVPVNLPVELRNYKSFSFRFNLLSGANLNNQSIMVYIAKNTSDFKQYGFGNPANSEHPQFADKLLGSTPAENIGDSHKNKWTNYEIAINNPGSAIKDLKGDLYIAIGINCQNGADYLLDDLTFKMKDDYNPPPIVVLPAPRPPSTGAVVSGNYRNMFKEWGKTDAEITAKVNNTWNKLFNGTETEKIYYTVGADMAYILDSGNNDVRSEGMSYGMMMCVQLDKKTEFDRLWKWAKTYMYNTTNSGGNSRGYFTWQLNTNGTVKGTGVAPDGDFYFTTALLFASARWGDGSGIFNYRQEARQLLYDMCHRKMGNPDPWDEPALFRRPGDNRNPSATDISGYYMPVFSPIGASSRHTDPSYHLPAFYEIWVLELENDKKNNQLSGIWGSLEDLQADIDFYKQVAQTSRNFFKTTINATTGLGPDYAEFNGTPTGGEHADFRFDAWRIAMNIATDYAWWAADSWQKTFADKIQAFFVGKGVTTYANQWKLDGTLITGDHSPGLVACNAVASLAAANLNAWKFIENFWEMPMTSGQYRYYDGCLYMMGLLHVSGNFKAYLSSNTTPVPNSVISPTSATFDKKTSQQADISVTMTLNGNTLTNIKNGATTLTSGTNYTVSGTSVTIKKEYLAAQSVGTTTLTFTFSAGSTQNLVITVVDTSNSSISPATATFDKRSDLQADITLTMTLNGNSLTSIGNGGTTLTSGTNYIVSGTTVTIKKEYLATQAVGTTTLVFTFNAGATSSLVITVKESPAGGGTGTSYNFAVDTFPAGYPKYSGSGVTAVVNGGVLQITKTTGHSTVYFTLPFDVGAGNLADYSGIKISIRGSSGDYTNKGFLARVGKSDSSTTMPLTSISNTGLSAVFKDITVPIPSTVSSYTGEIEIGFAFDNTPAFGCEIASIELIH
jgi:endo-1,4-beta-D-glucanase Y